MTIVGDRPESGVRIDVERPLSGGPPWRYEGEAVTPHARFRMSAVVRADGDVTVEVSDTAAGVRQSLAELAERLRRMMRAAWKHASEDALDAESAGPPPPPRRIVRWRPEP
jgi:hypothetical protein